MKEDAGKKCKVVKFPNGTTTDCKGKVCQELKWTSAKKNASWYISPMQWPQTSKKFIQLSNQIEIQTQFQKQEETKCEKIPWCK